MSFSSLLRSRTVAVTKIWPALAAVCARVAVFTTTDRRQVTVRLTEFTEFYNAAADTNSDVQIIFVDYAIYQEFFLRIRFFVPFATARKSERQDRASCANHNRADDNDELSVAAHY